MATRGVMQLQKLRLVYCEYGGSSAALRDYISSGKIIDWATNHSNAHVKVEVRNGKHPIVEGDYVTGRPKQVCVKNSTPKAIQQVMDMLYNSSGRKIAKLRKPVITATPSIQGIWTPMLNLKGEKPFDIKIV